MIWGWQVGIDKTNRKDGRNMELLKVRCPECSHAFHVQLQGETEDGLGFRCPRCGYLAPVAEFTRKESKLAAGTGIAFMVLMFFGIIGAVVSGQAVTAVIFTVLFIIPLVLVLKHYRA